MSRFNGPDSADGDILAMAAWSPPRQSNRRLGKSDKKIQGGAQAKMCAKMSANSARLAEIIRKYRHYPNFLGIEIADVNQPGSIDDTMLHIAAWKGEMRDVEVLVACGANVNAIGDIGNTPLHGAAAKGHLDVVKFLLAKGAAANIKNE